MVAFFFIARHGVCVLEWKVYLVNRRSNSPAFNTLCTIIDTALGWETRNIPNGRYEAMIILEGSQQAWQLFSM